VKVESISGDIANARFEAADKKVSALLEIDPGDWSSLARESFCQITG